MVSALVKRMGGQLSDYPGAKIHQDEQTDPRVDGPEHELKNVECECEHECVLGMLYSHG